MKFLMCVEREDEDCAVRKKRERHTHSTPTSLFPDLLLTRIPPDPLSSMGNPILASCLRSGNRGLRAFQVVSLVFYKIKEKE